MTGMPAMRASASAWMTAAMMVAMMLPSFAPTLWRRHRNLRATRASHAAFRTILFAIGYASVWTLLGLMLAALNGVWSSPPMAAGALVLCAGVLQRSRWKSIQLARCRDRLDPASGAATHPAAAWRAGARFGVQCVLSCAAPTLALFAIGVMDARAMAVVTGVVTVERLAPAGARIARWTGAIALAAGLVLCVR